LLNIEQPILLREPPENFLSEGKCSAAGSPQHGMLVDGSDHTCNLKDSSIKIMHEPIGIPQ
jgi:hypothetical protein